MLFNPIILMCQSPELIRTWYLSEFFPSDAYNEPYIISELEPSISPTLNFENENDISGNGACNTFTAEYNLEPTNSFMMVNGFVNTENICENENLTEFESAYFSTIQNNNFYVHEITEIENGYKLEMHTGIFGYAIFYSNPLAINNIIDSEFEVEIYPNPTSDILNIKSTCELNQITILDFNGKRINDINKHYNQINVSNLPLGNYIIKLNCDTKEYFKPFIKK